MSFDQSKADRICERLANGESLRKAAQAEGTSHTAVWNWTKESEEFANQYARARDAGYKLLADELIEIADDSSRDIIETEKGPMTDQEVIARSRLRVDTRKWMLSKMLPKVYGEKQTHEHTGPDGKPIQFQRLEVVIVDPKDSQ